MGFTFTAPGFGALEQRLRHVDMRAVYIQAASPLSDVLAQDTASRQPHNYSGRVGSWFGVHRGDDGSVHVGIHPNAPEAVRQYATSSEYGDLLSGPTAALRDSIASLGLEEKFSNGLTHFLFTAPMRDVT